MKIKTSYFYQIRNFKPYQIPLSTAISDPAWYHSKTEDYYIDKNGVINGLRIGMLQPQRSLGYLCGGKNCMQKPDKVDPDILEKAIVDSNVRDPYLYYALIKLVCGEINVT